MPKSRCPKCKRKMVLETEDNEQCTSETCTYFVDYEVGRYDDEYKEFLNG
jgi:hypothetical protein